MYFSLRSVWLNTNLTRPIVREDQFRFARDYFRYLDGNYHFVELFNRHGEHVIATTRAVLFADALWFDMRGVLPIVLFYVLLFAIAFLLAKAALDERPQRWQLAVAAIVGLGLTWSICQFLNFSWPFQIGFPFVHLFALGFYVALAHSLVAKNERSRWAWFGLACILDFLAVFSLGSGVFVGLPAIALAFWLRRVDRVLIGFVSFHVALVALYWLRAPLPTYPTDRPPASINLVADFLGWLFTGIGSFAGLSRTTLGKWGVTATLAAVAVASWIALVRRRPVDRSLAVLLALACFVILEALAAAYARSQYGMGPRYATPSVVFWAAILAAGWRATYFLDATRVGARAALLVAIFFVIVSANAPLYESEWSKFVTIWDKAMFSFASEYFPSDQLKKIGNSGVPTEDDIRRLATLRLGPFASSSHIYEAPTYALASLNHEELPPCRYKVDANHISQEGWSEIAGWAVNPGASNSRNWILAFSQAGKLLGYTRALDEAALPHSQQSDRIGFDLFLNSSAVRLEPMRSINVIVLSERMLGKNGSPACIFSVSLGEDSAPISTTPDHQN